MGIDPGYHRCGFGVLTKQGRSAEQLAGSGCMTTKPKTPLAERLNSLALDYDRLLVEWKPDAVAIEEIFFTKNVKTAIGVAQARGVILQHSAAHGIEVFEYTPTMVKSQLTGNGRADKKQVEFMVRKLVKVPKEVKLDDELDAIGVALCHVQRMAIPEVMR